MALCPRTHAARYDGHELASVLDATNSSKSVWADTAYRSARNEAWLKAQGYRSNIHRKKPRGKPMAITIRSIGQARAAVAWYKRLGVKVTRVMTDNGSCYISKAFAAACRNPGLKHIRTRPYTPGTNGKAERFIQTALREWAYARSYATSHERAQALPGWSHMYNWHRPHSGIRDKTPISRLKLDRNNLLRYHS